MFEIELIIYIKMDLALNNLQRLICHKTQPTNHRECLPRPELLWSCDISTANKYMFNLPHTLVRYLGASWHIDLLGLFNAKSILLEEQLRYYLTHSCEDKGFHAFPKSICPKMNPIAWLEFELAYYDSTIQRFNHYATRNPPHS